MTAPEILALAVLIVVLAISMIAVIEVKRRHLPVLSLIVRVFYWIARWWSAVAIGSDRALLEYREHCWDHPITALNDRAWQYREAWRERRKREAQNAQKSTAPDDVLFRDST